MPAGDGQFASQAIAIVFVRRQSIVAEAVTFGFLALQMQPALKQGIGLSTLGEDIEGYRSSHRTAGGPGPCFTPSPLLAICLSCAAATDDPNFNARPHLDHFGRSSGADARKPRPSHSILHVTGADLTGWL
ncbi:hypothetical protein, partial [Methylobacterium dankookense]